MSVSRITWLVAGKVPHSYKCIPLVRTLHCLTSKSCLFSGNPNGTLVDRNLASITNKTLVPLLQTCKRYKSGKKKTQQIQDEESDEEDEEDEEDTGDPKSKLISMRVNSMRIDLIIKATFNMARNKAEVALYESRIRINGEKALKKSLQVQVGDVLDLVRGPSPNNPDLLLVSRVTIMSVVAQDDAVRIKFTRDKSLLIENYENE